LRLTRGGLFLDKAHGEEIRQFAAAYRVPPKEKFATVGITTDPVTGRTLVHEGKCFFYLVNRDYYSVRAEVAFYRSPGRLDDLAAGKSVRAGRRWELTLGPYELRSFSMASDVQLASFSAKPPETIAADLPSDARKAVRALADLRTAGKFISGMDEMRRGFKSAIAEKRLAWLRRALTSYIVLNCREMAEAKTS
jgi:hypothetical protein